MELITQREDWDTILRDDFQKYEDIYFKYEYFEIYANNFNVKPECIVWSDKNVKIFHSYLVRDIKKIELFKAFKYSDLTTPYGYGGPIVVEKTENRKKVLKSIEEFFNNYKNFALDHNYVCEFIRFHPFLKIWEYLKGNVEIQYLNDIVFVDLTKDLKQLWKECRTDRKRNIKKSRKLNCTVNINSNPQKNDIKKFLYLYNITMDRNNALKKYYFSYEFFKQHFRLLKNNIILANAEYNGDVIGSSIFFYGNDNIHYHLSGSEMVKNVTPSEIILWEVINWSKERGLRKLLLGGGRAKNDSLFEFKRGFSNTYDPFYLGKIIFNKEIYNKLTKLAILNSSAKEDPNFFPLYRFNYDKNIV
ncbi:MAG: GNAT family N-acetyltransferase [Promethearchaeota archaeon]